MQITVAATENCPAPIETVFATLVNPERFPPMFRGFGPVAGIKRIELGQHLAAGAERRVFLDDGAMLTETVTALSAPKHHGYVLRGFVAPMSWLVRQGEADWQLNSTEHGTRVTWNYRFTLTSPLAAPVAFPLLRWFMATAMRRCLKALARSTRPGPEA